MTPPQTQKTRQPKPPTLPTASRMLIPNTEQTLVYHSRNTRFLHRGVGLEYFDSAKGSGLFTKCDINAGEILFVEGPLLKIQNERHDDLRMMMNRIHSNVQSEHQRDPQFSRIWQTQIRADNDMKHRYESLRSFRGFADFIKVLSNRFGVMNSRKPLSVYALLSKINFGLPQNVAVMFGDKNDDELCAVMATTDIAKGTELVTDYLFDWFRLHPRSKSESLIFKKYYREFFSDSLYRVYLSERKNIGEKFGFQQNAKWMKVIEDLNSENTSKRQKYEIAARELYPNGIIGKRRGKPMDIVNGGHSESHLAQKIKKMVDSHQFADILDGAVSCDQSLWTGTQFCDEVTLRRKYILETSKF